jgi:hypothetical protein
MVVTDAEIEGMRGRIAGAGVRPRAARLSRTTCSPRWPCSCSWSRATFPVVLPFCWSTTSRGRKGISRAIALAMLFAGGMALGRYAGYGGWKAGFLMMGVGAALVAAIMALGG